MWFAGKGLWVVSSTALLLGVPLVLCWADEQNMAAMEEEYRMREAGGQMLTADGAGGGTADRASAALGAETKAAL
jgi:import receptor subunit TOM22